MEAYLKQNNASFFTRQIAVAHKGKLVGDPTSFIDLFNISGLANAEGFQRTMPLLGWSMTKSVVNYFVGRLVQLGKVNITDKGFSCFFEDNKSSFP